MKSPCSFFRMVKSISSLYHKIFIYNNTLLSIFLWLKKSLQYNAIYVSIQNLLKKWVSRVIDEKISQNDSKSGKKLRIKFGIDQLRLSCISVMLYPILKLRGFKARSWNHRPYRRCDSTSGDSSTGCRASHAHAWTNSQNAEKYLSYFGKILDLKKVEVYYNSEGLDAVNFCG